MIVRGTVDGDVEAFAGSVRISGTVGSSVDFVAFPLGVSAVAAV